MRSDKHISSTSSRDYGCLLPVKSSNALTCKLWHWSALCTKCGSSLVAAKTGYNVFLIVVVLSRFIPLISEICFVPSWHHWGQLAVLRNCLAANDSVYFSKDKAGLKLLIPLHRSNKGGQSSQRQWQGSSAWLYPGRKGQETGSESPEESTMAFIKIQILCLPSSWDKILKSHMESGRKLTPSCSSINHHPDCRQVLASLGGV